MSASDEPRTPEWARISGKTPAEDHEDALAMSSNEPREIDSAEILAAFNPPPPTPLLVIIAAVLAEVARQDEWQSVAFPDTSYHGTVEEYNEAIKRAALAVREAMRLKAGGAT